MNLSKTAAAVVTGLATAALTGTVLAGTAEAQPAHSTYLYWHEVLSAWGGIDSNSKVFVCDESTDGHSAYVAYTDGSGGHRLVDPNGGTQGCGTKTPSGQVSKYQVCLDITLADDPCTAVVSPPIWGLATSRAAR